MVLRRGGTAATSSDQQECWTLERTDGSWWYSCNTCQNIHYITECFCCYEWGILEKGSDTVDEPSCVTSHSNFNAHLNPGVFP